MRGINVVRLPSPVDPPATSQDQALHEVAIFAGSIRASRRIDHSGRDAWKTQPVQLSDFQIVCCVHRSVPTAVANRNAIPGDLILRIVNHELRFANWDLNLRAASSDNNSHGNSDCHSCDCYWPLHRGTAGLAVFFPLRHLMVPAWKRPGAGLACAGTRSLLRRPVSDAISRYRENVAMRMRQRRSA